jgi:DNA-binding transcriptional regulator YdaS (Cro superfamily)
MEPPTPTRHRFLSGIERAVRAAGNQSRLADELGVRSQAVCQWVAQGYVPVDRALEIERLYGVPREALVAPRLRPLIIDSHQSR